MPYIQQNLRNEIDADIEVLAVKLAALPVEKQDGALNYTVTKLLKKLYPEDSYFTLNRSMGTLASIQAEWYRRWISPYEDRKITENGDI